MNKELSPEKESESLINELESIYLQSGWRKDDNKVIREKEIKDRLSVILGGNTND